ncbi:MAG: hypothetical protein ACREE9_17250, partial [Stellaceae bacterium]
RKGDLAMSDDAIPTVEIYRGVGIQDRQPAERIVRVVKPAIDHVHDKLADPDALLRYARDPSRPPEARLLAVARIEAIFELAIERRETRPAIDLDLARAAVAGLDSQAWRSPTHYCSDLDVITAPGPQPVRREVPLE